VQLSVAAQLPGVIVTSPVGVIDRGSRKKAPTRPRIPIGIPIRIQRVLLRRTWVRDERDFTSISSSSALSGAIWITAGRSGVSGTATASGIL
jgi:hypothetical protein